MMFKKLNLTIAAIALCGIASAASATTVLENGGIGVILDDPPIVVGDAWGPSVATPPAFFWADGAGAWNMEGPFTYTSLVDTVLFVTDDYLVGDIFEIFDYGISIGSTSVVATGVGGEVGPNAAFIDPTYSSGTFSLAAGSHSITIKTTTNPYGGGRGYLKVEEDAGNFFVIPVPEPGTLAMFGFGLAGLGFIRRRRAV